MEPAPRKTLVAVWMVVTLVGACASSAPRQLLDARRAYAAANAGVENRLTPSDVYEARKMLDRANQEFEANGDTADCRDYAYVAHRKLELATVKARLEMDRRRVVTAETALADLRAERRESQEQQLATTRAQLEDAKRENQLQTASLREDDMQQRDELDHLNPRLDTGQRQRRAPVSFARALKDLARVAAVTVDSRGTVITLPGSVLFAPGADHLLLSAKSQLDPVAVALRAAPRTSHVEVEGHTDTQGEPERNVELSHQRARAVREYLRLSGVDAARLTAVGLGSQYPIANNATPEGRANNRRVEVVIMQHAPARP